MRGLLGVALVSVLVLLCLCLCVSATEATGQELLLSRAGKSPKAKKAPKPKKEKPAPKPKVTKPKKEKPAPKPKVTKPKKEKPAPKAKQEKPAAKPQTQPNAQTQPQNEEKLNEPKPTLSKQVQDHLAGTKNPKGPAASSDPNRAAAGAFGKDPKKFVPTSDNKLPFAPKRKADNDYSKEEKNGLHSRLDANESADKYRAATTDKDKKMHAGDMAKHSKESSKQYAKHWENNKENANAASQANQNALTAIAAKKAQAMVGVDPNSAKGKQIADKYQKKADKQKEVNQNRTYQQGLAKKAWESNVRKTADDPNGTSKNDKAMGAGLDHGWTPQTPKPTTTQQQTPTATTT